MHWVLDGHSSGSKHTELLVAFLSLTALSYVQWLPAAFTGRGDELELQCAGHYMKALCLSSLHLMVCTTFSSAMTYWLPEPRSVPALSPCPARVCSSTTGLNASD